MSTRNECDLFNSIVEHETGGSLCFLEIYNALRPYRSTRAELLAIAEELETKYNAKISGGLVREAAAVYEARGRLKKD